MRLPLLPALALLAACPRPSADPASTALAEARAALVERDRRLAAFHLEVTTTQGDSRARHEVSWRSPNKSHGRLLEPQALELAFDGTTFVKVDHAARTHERFEVRLSPDRAAHFLAGTFLPFVPDGYRAPLLPARGLRAREVTRPDASRAVSLEAPLPDQGNGPASVAYLLRLPAGDLLEKRITAGAHVRVLAVTREHCDETLRLCVPLELHESLDGQPLGTTTVTSVALNPALPNDGFLPPPPQGYATAHRELVDADPADGG